MIPGPGIYDDIDEATYHADMDLAPELGRSLSASGAKVLLRNPARFNWERSNPRPSTDSMDLGSVAHHLILKRGGDLLIVDAYDWKASANQKLRKEKRAQGVVVVHRGEFLLAVRMARAVLRHVWSIDGVEVGTLGDTLFAEGRPEVSLYWIDETTGVTCRGRIDWLHPRAIVDVKTARDASPYGFAKACADYGYRESAAHYSKGVRVLTEKALPFYLVVVESTAPHFVAVYQFTEADLAYGEERMAEALATYAACESSGEWPGYPNDVQTLEMPRWAPTSKEF
jgi:hypothetical protein